MNVLLLGGTGAMGSSLVGILAEEGVDVYVTSRSSHISKDHIHYIQGNASDKRFLQTLLSDKYDVIVDFIIRPTEEFQQLYPLFLDSTLQYVFISSARVYAESDNPITEDSPRILDVCKNADYLKTDEYALRKARCENLLMDSERKNWTIIRPYITYNGNRLQLCEQEKEYWLYRAIQGRSIVCSTDILDKTTTITYGGDVAYALSKIIGNHRALGDVYQITAPYQMKWRDILDLYADLLSRRGLKVKLKEVPRSLFLSMPQRASMVVYDRQYNRVFDSSKVYQLVGKEMFRSPQEGLAISVNSFMDKPAVSIPSYYDEAVRDRITGERINMDEFAGFKSMLIYLKYRFKR